MNVIRPQVPGARGFITASTLVLAVLVTPSLVLAQTPRPAVGPERPFTPPPRVERTLPNGLRVVAVR